MKRGASREIRRTIVGQLLEYAALAAETWTADTLRQEFEETALEQGRDPGIVLAELLQVDHDPDADKFWDQVATNLAARRLRLLFVADHIPEPLEQVVRFLNEQMPRIEVLAVEIKQYRGKVIHAVIPRVIGQTSGAPRPMTRNQAAPRVDLAPYREVLHTNQPGEMITWQLRADETIRRARRRLTLAAREEGLAIRHHQRLDQPQAIKLTVDGPVPPVPVATPEGT